MDRRGLFEALFYALGTDALAPLADTSDSLSTEASPHQLNSINSQLLSCWQPGLYALSMQAPGQ